MKDTNEKEHEMKSNNYKRQKISFIHEKVIKEKKSAENSIFPQFGAINGNISKRDEKFVSK